MSAAEICSKIAKGDQLDKTQGRHRDPGAARLRRAPHEARNRPTARIYFLDGIEL